MLIISPCNYAILKKLFKLELLKYLLWRQLKKLNL
jgi:hypothetical protein